MKPKCEECNRAGVRLSARSKPSPYYMCPKCKKVINIKCNDGSIKLIELKVKDLNEVEKGWEVDLGDD